MNVAYAERMQRVKPSAIGELLKLGAEPDIIAFGGGFPDASLFPMDALRQTYDQVFSRYGGEALQYSISEGILPLREKLAIRMQNAGVACGTGNIQLVQGAQQGLDLIGKLFINKGDIILVERPTFIGALVAFIPYEPQFREIPMTDDGMDLDYLEALLRTTRNIKLIYTVPEFQNPTGKTMPAANRMRLVELAEKYHVMILEDSPYREIRYTGEAVAPIKSFDECGHVIHLGSFSKILCPGLRVGWIVADEDVTKKLCQLKMAADTQNTTLNMYAIDVFLAQYDLDAHIERLCDAYHKKRDLMLSVMDAAFPDDILYTRPEGGLFTWVTLPRHMDAAEVMREKLLPEARVAYIPGDEFFAATPEKNHFRANFTFVSNEKITEGIIRMGETFRRCLK